MEKSTKASKLDELKALNKKVKKPAFIFAYIFGSISSLILGTGMSVAMGVIMPHLFYAGLAVGVLGIILCSVNYPIYKKILLRRRIKYSEEIISLSNELLNENC